MTRARYLTFSLQNKPTEKSIDLGEGADLTKFDYLSLVDEWTVRRGVGIIVVKATLKHGMQLSSEIRVNDMMMELTDREAIQYSKADIALQLRMILNFAVATALFGMR